MNPPPVIQSCEGPESLRVLGRECMWGGLEIIVTPLDPHPPLRTSAGGPQSGESLMVAVESGLEDLCQIQRISLFFHLSVPPPSFTSLQRHALMSC